MVIEPPYDSFAGFVTAFYDPARWAEAKWMFAANDPFFDRWLFEETALDHSPLVRPVRRARSQSRDR